MRHTVRRAPACKRQRGKRRHTGAPQHDSAEPPFWVRMRHGMYQAICRVVRHVASEPVGHFGLHAAAILHQRILPIGVGSRMCIALVK